MNTTRPDISNAVRYMGTCARPAREAAGGCDKDHPVYLKGAREMGPTRRKVGRCRLEAFTHASYAEDEEDGGSVSGIVMKFGGASLLWASRTQEFVTLSSSEGEYVTLADCAKHALYLTKLLDFLRPALSKMRVKSRKITKMGFDASRIPSSRTGQST